MKGFQFFGFVFAIVSMLVGCHEAADHPSPNHSIDAPTSTHGPGNTEANSGDGEQDRRETSGESETEAEALCHGNLISAEAVDEMLLLTDLTDHEDIYSTYDRIDAISTLFEACEDTWGLFPLTYRHITARGIRAIENGEFEDPDWARRIIVDFAGRYMANLRLALQGKEPSWAWAHYYYLADNPDVSRTRSVLVAMVAHLTLDLPHSLVAIETTEVNKNDFFVFGEMMIEVADDFIADLIEVYDTDAEDILNGFFFGDWVDGAFGPDTTITLSYQTIRTKSWNNRWLLEQSWGGWVADSEIYSAFWAIDGVLATLDAAGTI